MEAEESDSSPSYRRSTERYGVGAWLEALTDTGHLLFWLYIVTISIPVAFRLIFFEGKFTYKPDRAIGFYSWESFGHFVQGFFCCVSLFFSSRFSHNGSWKRHPMKSVTLIVYLGCASIYLTYNLIKRLITSGTFFADSSFFVNQSDVILGNLVGYVALILLATMAQLYDRCCSTERCCCHWEILAWLRPFMLVQKDFVLAQKLVGCYAALLQVVVLTMFFVTLQQVNPKAA